MPNQTPPPTDASRAVVVVGMPDVYQSTAPYSRALVPSVATIGLRRMRPISVPLTRPATTAAPNATAIAAHNRLLSPAGYLVTITTYSEKPPATDRSMPPCMTTSVCPRAAMASAEANGSMVSSVPLVTLEDANTRLTTNSPTVATTTVRRPRESTLRDPLGTVPLPSVEPAICG